MFELLFSDGLYNFARRGEEKSVFFWYKSFNVFVSERRNDNSLIYEVFH